LVLRRLEGELPRRKKPGFGVVPPRNNLRHGADLSDQILEVIKRNAAEKDTVKDPSIVLKISAQGYVSEDALAGVGLTVLAQRENGATIALSNDPNLESLVQKAGQYSGPIPKGQKGAQHEGLFAPVDDFCAVEPADRIGTALIEEGFGAFDQIPEGRLFLLDVELWDAGEESIRQIYLERVRKKVQEFDGDFLSQYFGAGLFIARVRISGAGLKALLDMSEVSWVDLPPVPDFAPDPKASATIADLQPLVPPSPESVCIGIIDSGITSGHPMLAGVVAGAFGVPGSFGSDDQKGHGTSVSSIASYGDLGEQLAQPELTPLFRIASAKVVDSRGEFSDNRPLPDIIEEAVRRLNSEFGCRVINISLADIKHVVGGRPSNWAMTLDNLVRELGLIVTISAGNIASISERISIEGLGIYPGYLLEQSARIYEPASSLNSLVVGSLSHSNGLLPIDEEYADTVAITGRNLPSPFSRSGPGYGGAIKPDIAEYGGSAVWRGSVAKLTSDRPSCGILALNHDYLQSLLTYRHGTSFASPRAAYKAAKLLEEFPDSSANFIRALMGLGSYHPTELTESVATGDKRTAYHHAGYGVTDVGLASHSEDSRVVLAAEDSLPIDGFAVYEIPIPTDYQTVRGKRHIRVSLAYDPPVRNSRRDYAGVKMGYHLVRGKSSEEVFERFRRWDKDEKDANGGAYNFEGQNWNCKMVPLPSIQEKGTLQVGTFVQKRDVSRYGDTYFLVVRCEGKWAAKLIEAQTFAIAVELFHEAELDLYQKISVRLNA
jgi:hypothetical protein